MSSALLRHVGWLTLIDVLEVLAASIIRTTYLMMEVAGTSETSINFHFTSYGRRESLKSDKDKHVNYAVNIIISSTVLK
jgi:hypothetical protein